MSDVVHGRLRALLGTEEIVVGDLMLCEVLQGLDGERAALEAIVDGELGASVECNPRFGPKAAETTLAYAAGQTIPPKIINPDQFFDASNAKENIAAAY